MFENLTDATCCASPCQQDDCASPQSLALAAFLATLPPGVQRNVRESAERGESITKRALDFGYSAGLEASGQCPNCGGADVTEHALRENVPFDEAGEVSLLLPLHVCKNCGMKWTDETGSMLKEAAVSEARAAKRQGARGSEVGRADSSPEDLRSRGWSVAVHNDYRLNGQAHTFWLFTKGNRNIKGEGRTDAEALNAARASEQALAGKLSGTASEVVVGQGAESLAPVSGEKA